jgi:hypothetical protein
MDFLLRIMLNDTIHIYNAKRYREWMRGNECYPKNIDIIEKSS